jgi:hypothetical protein
MAAPINTLMTLVFPIDKKNWVRIIAIAKNDIKTPYNHRYGAPSRNPPPKSKFIANLGKIR